MQFVNFGLKIKNIVNNIENGWNSSEYRAFLTLSLI